MSTKLLSEITSRHQIGKAPPIGDLAFSNDSPSMPRLNMSQLMKVDYPAAQLEIQFVGRDGKLHDVRVFSLVRYRLPALRFKHHITPLICALSRSLTQQMRQFCDISQLCRRSPHTRAVVRCGRGQ
jgi:hypothetical protein